MTTTDNKPKDWTPTPEERRAAWQKHHDDAVRRAKQARDSNDGYAFQVHQQTAKFYKDKLNETLEENVVRRVVDAARHGAAETHKAGLSATSSLSSTPVGMMIPVAHGAAHAADYLTGGKLSGAASKVVSGAKKLFRKEDWTVGPRHGEVPVLAIQGNRKKSQYKDAFGADVAEEEEFNSEKHLAQFRHPHDPKARWARLRLIGQSYGSNEAVKHATHAENAHKKNDHKAFEDHMEKGLKAYAKHRGIQYSEPKPPAARNITTRPPVRKEELEESSLTISERRGLMRMALRGVRAARIRAQREASRAANARRDAEAAASGGGDDPHQQVDDQPMFHHPARKFKTEETMTASEKKKREDIVMGMKKNKADLKKRYGDRWKDVMYATATKQAMEGKVSSELPTNPKNLPVLKERDPSTGRLRNSKSRAAQRVEEIVNCGKNKIDTEPTYNQLGTAGNGGTGYRNT